MQTSQEQFEKWVAEAVDSLPEKFRKQINNLAIFIEDKPNDGHLKKAKLLGRGRVLLGLYKGYHQSKRLDLGPVLPDRITIFKRPLESISRNEDDLKKKIKRTVRHEIAHHFGSDEAGAHKVG